MARTGLRMMPTFPSSPLRFRTAGFPQYGSKAGFRTGPARVALDDHRVSWFASVLRVARGQHFASLSVEVVGSARHRHTSGISALPQGPSLQSGL